MQNCKLVTIHKNTTTRNNITGVRRCFTATAAHRNHMLIKSARTHDSRVCDCVLKWQRLRLMKIKNLLLQLNQETVKWFRVAVCGTG